MPVEYEDTELWPFVQVMRAARNVGGPAMVEAIEDMELWQIAEALGQNDITEPRDDPEAQVRSGRDLARARWEAHKAGRELVADEVPPDPDSAAFAEQFRRIATG